MPYYPDKAGHLILLDMVNDLRSANYQPGQLVFGQPETTLAHGRNTVVPVQPPQGTSFRLHYNRLDIQQLFGELNLPIQYDAYQTTRDLMPFLNTLYENTAFIPADIIDTPIPSSGFPRQVALVAAHSSWLLMGECLITITGTNALSQLLTEEGSPILTQENAAISIEE